MACISTLLRHKAHAELLRFRSMKVVSHGANRNFSKSENIDEFEEENTIAEIEEEEEVHLEQLRNVSGLSDKHYQQYHGMSVQPFFQDLQRQRKMYQVFGSNSSEDSRLLWPSRQELLRLQDEERYDEVPLQEKIQIMKQEKDDEMKEKSERQKMIEKNMAQMEKWISDYYQKVSTAEADVQKRREKKEALLDEARDFFGYRVKANDPKFQQMVEEKEERERKEAKELKKKEKARKLAERLKQDMLAMTTKSNSGDGNKSPEKSS